MALVSVLFIRATPALVAALDAYQRERQARTPDRHVSRNELVLSLLRAALRQVRDAEATPAPDAAVADAPPTPPGRRVRGRFVVAG